MGNWPWWLAIASWLLTLVLSLLAVREREVQRVLWLGAVRELIELRTGAQGRRHDG